MKPTEILSDSEKTKIMGFMSDDVLVNAVKKVLLQVMYGNGVLKQDQPADPTRNAALALANLAISGRGTISNEELGADLRGLMHGISLMEQGFNHLAKIKPEEDKDAVESPYNEAI